MEAIKQIVPGANLPVSYLTHSWTQNSPAFASEPKYSRYPKLPFFRTQDSVCVTRWKLTWRERLQLAISGSVWHSVSLANVNLQPFRLHIVCPLKVAASTPVATVMMGGDTESLAIPPAAVTGLPTVVLMSSRGMLDAADGAELATFDRKDGIVTISGHRELGEFATEDEALAAFAIHLRQKNKGKSRPSA